jgi:hypothetical protein
VSQPWPWLVSGMSGNLPSLTGEGEPTCGNRRVGPPGAAPATDGAPADVTPPEGEAPPSVGDPANDDAPPNDDAPEVDDEPAAG